MKRKAKTVEQILDDWAKQPGAIVTAAERQFIEHMREAARNGVGYGWMQGIIEMEWNHKGLGAWGPVKGTLTTLTHEKEALEAKVVVMGEALATYVRYDEYINGPDGDPSTDRLQVARAALSNLPDRVKALQNLVKASKALDDALEFTPEMFFRNKAFQESITEPIHEAVRAYVKGE